MRSHYSTWSPARAHGSLAAWSVTKITNWKILFNIRRKEKLNREGKKEIEIDKRNLHLMFCFVYFILLSRKIFQISFIEIQ